MVLCGPVVRQIIKQLGAAGDAVQGAAEDARPAERAQRGREAARARHGIVEPRDARVRDGRA
jgi:hypothetical protein